jgi:hypothetical protein
MLDPWQKRFTFAFHSHPEFRLWPDMTVATVEPSASAVYVATNPGLGHTRGDPIWRDVVGVTEELGNELPLAVRVVARVQAETFEQDYVPRVETEE